LCPERVFIADTGNGPGQGFGGRPSPKVEKRTFKVGINGYQNNRWDFHHVAESKCDQTVQSSGHEYLSFATRRSVTLEVLRIGDSVVFGTRRSDVNGINLRVRLDRGATHTASPLDPTCTRTTGDERSPRPRRTAAFAKRGSTCAWSGGTFAGRPV
jgi:hypothetical protein